MPPTDTAIPGRKPQRTNSRKRVRARQPAQSLVGGAPTQKRAQQINAYYDLKKNSPALKAARITRQKRLNAAKFLAAQAAIPVQWRALMVIFRVIIMALVLFVMFRVMLKEKQLLAVKNAIMLKGGSGTMRDSLMTWHSFQRAYETRYRRAPVEDFHAWLDFAQTEACEPFKLYNAIDRDLAPFRRQLKSNTTRFHWDQLEAIATGYAKGAYLLVEIKDHSLIVLEQDLSEWYDQHPTIPSAPIDGTRRTFGTLRNWYRSYRVFIETRKLLYNLQWLMDPVIRHKKPNPIHTRFVVNLHATPKSPATEAQVPIFSSHHEHHHTDADPTHPGSLALEIANKNRNGVVDPRDETTRDLLLPHLSVAGGRMGAAGMTSSPSIGGFWFWPFFREGKPWEKRQKAIVWRGSTLGNYRTHSTIHNDTVGATNALEEFFVGPRFDMMKRWGGTGVHPIADNVDVNVDFAFTKLIVQGQEHMNVKTVEAIQTKAKNEYRFVNKRMSFGTMQKYQYLMDVDSNGTSVKFFCALTHVWYFELFSEVFVSILFSICLT